jgi:hypothetical protein
MPDKPDLARGWMFVEKLLREEDLERLDQTSDEDVERQLRAAGIDPKDVPTADELLARAAARARKRREEGPRASARIVAPPARPKRNAWAVWLVAAAIGAVIVTLVVGKREVRAWWHRDATEPVEPEPTRPLTP